MSDIKKQFCLEQIAPYFLDPSTCGFDSALGACCYLTADGKMCVVGKNLIKPGAYYSSDSAKQIISSTQEELKIESRGILEISDWNRLQRIHDHIAYNHLSETYLLELKTKCDNLELFTLEELQTYCNTINK